MKFDAGNSDAAVLVILFMLGVLGLFACLASVGAQAGLAIPTPGPIWPPTNAF
jgi:membrane-bound ClpP family serine protease